MFVTRSPTQCVAPHKLSSLDIQRVDGAVEPPCDPQSAMFIELATVDHPVWKLVDELLIGSVAIGIEIIGHDAFCPRHGYEQARPVGMYGQAVWVFEVLRAHPVTFVRTHCPKRRLPYLDPCLHARKEAAKQLNLGRAWERNQRDMKVRVKALALG